MTSTHNSSPAGDVTPRDWHKILMHYREPNVRRSTIEILATAVPFVIFWALAWASLEISYALSLLLVLPSAAFLLRLFLIQHDCGHGAFFRSRGTNDWVGRVIGVFTFTPYEFWRRAHATHHATSGNLSRRGTGDITTLTTTEYENATFLQRLRYRLYRNPLVLFVVGPAYLFLLQHRVPRGQMRNGWTPWISAMATNVGIAVVVVSMMWLVGVKPFLLVHLPVVLLAASVGVWMFYVQHQYETVYWEHEEDWTLHEAALYGSSYYDLPGPLPWLTANIGVHHVHHLYSRIPFYRLSEVLRDHPKLAAIGRITLRDSLSTVPLTLWDERLKRLVSFKEASRLSRERAVPA